LIKHIVGICAVVFLYFNVSLFVENTVGTGAHRFEPRLQFIFVRLCVDKCASYTNGNAKDLFKFIPACPRVAFKNGHGRYPFQYAYKVAA
jgi:hypothetical protein